MNCSNIFFWHNNYNAFLKPYFKRFKVAESRIWHKIFRFHCFCFVIQLTFISSPVILFFLAFVIDGFTLWLFRQAQMSTIHYTENYFFVNKGIAQTMSYIKKQGFNNLAKLKIRRFRRYACMYIKMATARTNGVRDARRIGLRAKSA